MSNNCLSVLYKHIIQVKIKMCGWKWRGAQTYHCSPHPKQKRGGTCPLDPPPPQCMTVSYFSFQPVLHDWCNKGRGMCYPVCGMVHIKEPLLLIGNSSPCGGSGFPLSLSEWSFTICLTPYNRKQNVLRASLNKTFPSFLSWQWANWFCFLRRL